MNRRIFPPAVIFLLLALAAWWFWPEKGSPAAPAIPRSTPAPSAGRPPDPSPVSVAVGITAGPVSPAPAEERIALADDLNAREGDIQSDLRVVNTVFQAWLTNFPRSGNPVGENAEITAALTGDNPLRLALVPGNHRAINARGELCDRWGTPFRFHQLSGSRMEIRSAGPDRKFGTDDDAGYRP